VFRQKYFLFHCKNTLAYYSASVSNAEIVGLAPVFQIGFRAYGKKAMRS
jgi:hypothetical protein